MKNIKFLLLTLAITLANGDDSNQPEDLLLEHTKTEFRNKFLNEDGINVDCVMNELGIKKFWDNYHQKQIALNSKEMSSDEINKIVKDAKDIMKPILNDAAQSCNSDPDWGLHFVDVLGLDTASQTHLERYHCILKFSLDQKYIDLENINTNPHNIDISNVDCNTIIKQQAEKVEKQGKKYFQESHFSEGHIYCFVKVGRESEIFKKWIAVDALLMLDIDPKILQESIKKINKSMESAEIEINECRKNYKSS